MKVFWDWMEDILRGLEGVKIGMQGLGNRVEGFGNIGRDFKDLEKGYFIWVEVQKKSGNGKNRNADKNDCL
jgi:hypothetical protein